MSESKHPAARSADQLAWAIWIDTPDGRECLSVVGDSEQEAREAALARHGGAGDVCHVDGPFPDADPGRWEFEFVTEHRETVVVDAPCEDYAAETAEAERSYRGRLVQTLHTESRRLNGSVSQEDGDSE